MQRLTHEGVWLQFRPPTATLQWKQRKRERKMQLKKEERESKSTMPARIGDGLFFIQWAAWQTGLAPVAARDGRRGIPVSIQWLHPLRPRSNSPDKVPKIPQGQPKVPALQSATGKFPWALCFWLQRRPQIPCLPPTTIRRRQWVRRERCDSLVPSNPPAPRKDPSRRTLQPINSVPQ